VVLYFVYRITGSEILNRL